MRINLRPGFFAEARHLLVDAPAGRATTFRYASGVEALEVATDRVTLTVLPFRGQQWWRLVVDGEDVTMKTHFDEPTASVNFGESYGAFLLHCGLSGTGAPGPDDTHLHHGELPSAPYQRAWLEAGADADGPWLAVAGEYQHRVSHGYHYAFRPRAVLRPGSGLIDVAVEVENFRAGELGYSYLCHVNWPLWEGGRLEQSVPMDVDHVELAPHPAQDAATASYLERIGADLEASNAVSPGLAIVPEYCAVLRPVPDADGWAHFRQRRPDGRAAYVGYETAHLPYAVRWISNTGDEQASGFCLPSTGHHFGRARSEADGLVRTVAGGAKVAWHMRVGLTDD